MGLARAVPFPPVRVPMPSPEPPAFGQVWRFGGSAVMLICPVNDDLGAWRAISLEGDWIRTWYGLYEDRQMMGWTRLDTDMEVDTDGS